MTTNLQGDHRMLVVKYRIDCGPLKTLRVHMYRFCAGPSPQNKPYWYRPRQLTGCVLCQSAGWHMAGAASSREGGCCRSSGHHMQCVFCISCRLAVVAFFELSSFAHVARQGSTARVPQHYRLSLHAEFRGCRVLCQPREQLWGAQLSVKGPASDRGQQQAEIATPQQWGGAGPCGSLTGQLAGSEAAMASQNSLPG